MYITYHTQSRKFFVKDCTGKTLFSSWNQGVCQDYINDQA